MQGSIIDIESCFFALTLTIFGGKIDFWKKGDIHNET